MTLLALALALAAPVGGGVDHPQGHAHGPRRPPGHARSPRYSPPWSTATASWYGPGLYGNRTACGQTLTPGLLGVANKSLPCGYRLQLSYGRWRVTVPVVDRGPYVGGRTFDLTGATRDRLGFPDGVATLRYRRAVR